MVLCMPILVGTDGIEKMSKSKNNYIGLTDAPNDMFGKVMSIPDSALPSYCKLVTGWSASEIDNHLTRLSEGTLHPMDLKKELAEAVVERFHSTEDASLASEFFRRNYQKKDDAVFTQVSISGLGLLSDSALLDLVVAVEPEFSRSHAKRMIAQSAVKIDSMAITDPNIEVTLSSGTRIEVGKHTKIELN